MRVTPRQLYDAAIQAGLEVPGLALAPKSLINTAETVLTLYPVVNSSYAPGRWPSPSLADVECAVMDALVDRKIFVRPVWPQWFYGRQEGESGWLCYDANGIADEGGEELTAVEYLGHKFSNPDPKPHPTRADALLAACEAIAKEKK